VTTTAITGIGLSDHFQNKGEVSLFFSTGGGLEVLFRS